MRLLTLIVVLLPLTALAQQTIYKQVNPDGSVSYSDEPMSDEAERIVLPPASVVETDRARPTPRQTEQPEEASEDEEEIVYTELRFNSPRPEENLWGTGGQVLASLAIAPNLAPGHRIRYTLDGAIVAETRSTRVALTDVFRGQHSLGATVIAEDGEILMQATPVIFHMMQQSLLNPNSPLNRANQQSQG